MAIIILGCVAGGSDARGATGGRSATSPADSAQKSAQTSGKSKSAHSLKGSVLSFFLERLFFFCLKNRCPSHSLFVLLIFLWRDLARHSPQRKTIPTLEYTLEMVRL